MSDLDKIKFLANCARHELIKDCPYGITPHRNHEGVSFKCKVFPCQYGLELAIAKAGKANPLPVVYNFMTREEAEDFSSRFHPGKIQPRTSPEIVEADPAQGHGEHKRVPCSANPEEDHH